MNRIKHGGDCTIYESLINCVPEAGICACGYGSEHLREKGDFSELYSNELINKLKSERIPIARWQLDSELDKLMENFRE